MPTFWERTITGFKAFKEAFMYSGDGDITGDYSDFESRKLRYAINFAHYENNVYRDINKWAPSYKASFGLYRYVRSLYSPAYRLAEFWKSHLWGGALDPDAGDGKSIPSALPIIADNDALRPAIANIFRWSNFEVKKNVISLKGAILGDGIIKVVDDVDHQRVYLKSVHPGTLKSVITDETGNVKYYYIEEQRPDPIKLKKLVKYGEEATRNGDMVVYRTYLDGKPFAWPDNVMSNGEFEGAVDNWEEPYGFIPMVLIQHNDVGLEWGWSEFHAGHPKIREADELASKLSDQIRKAIEAPMLLAGVKKPTATPTVQRQAKTEDNPEPGREELSFLYADLGAQAHPLYSELNIQQTAAYIQDILRALESDYPELEYFARKNKFTGEISGRAMREMRQDAEDKVNERRPLYDDPLSRALQMSISIGGMRGYDGFESFNLDSYNKGDLELSIGKRPVFTKDPLEDLEEESLFWDVATKAKNNGMSIPLWLEKKGWEEDDVDKFIGSPEYQARLEAMKMANQGAVANADEMAKKRAENMLSANKGVNK